MEFTLPPTSALSVSLINKDTIYLLGDAPSLVKFGGSVGGNDYIIALNRSFLKHRADIHFFACKKFVEEYQDKFNKSLVVIHPKSLGFFGFRKEYVYNPVWDIDRDNFFRLKAGHSVLIPALHFALLCKPKRIVLHGVELRKFDHWDDENQCFRRFPARTRICREVKELVRAFQTPVFSGSKNSLLVESNILEVA